MAAGDERALLLALARVPSAGTDAEQERISIEDSFDWDRFVALARLHRVLPLVAHHLSGIGGEIVPDPVRQAYAPLLLQNGIRGLQFAKTVLEIIGLAANKGIVIVPFKGPVAALQLFGDVALRSYNDLDFLIAEKDIFAVVDLLHEQGYRPEIDIAPGSFKAFSAVEDSISLSAPDKPNIDLHWEISGHYLLSSYTYASVADRLSRTSLFGREISILSNEDTLIYYCLHGTKHNWQHYEMVISVARQVESMAIDWPKVLSLATNMRCRRMLCVGLILAHKLYGLLLPAEVSACCQHDAKVRSLTDSVVNRLFNEPRAGSVEGARFTNFHLQVRDSVVDAMRYQLRLFLVPTMAEWKLFRCPYAWMTIIYWLVRPVRIIATFTVTLMRRGWGLVNRRNPRRCRSILG